MERAQRRPHRLLVPGAARLQFAAQNHFERSGPCVRGEKWQSLAFAWGFSRRCLAPRKQQAAVANRKELGGFFRGSDSDAVRIGSEGSLVKVGEVAYAGGKVRADRQRPERAARTHLSLVRSSGLPEALDIGIRGSREEEQLVEIALAQEFRLALRQSGVL